MDSLSEIIIIIIVESIFYAYYKHHKSDKISLYCLVETRCVAVYIGASFSRKLPIALIICFYYRMEIRLRANLTGKTWFLTAILVRHHLSLRNCCKDTTDNRGTKGTAGKVRPAKIDKTQQSTPDTNERRSV